MPSGLVPISGRVLELGSVMQALESDKISLMSCANIRPDTVVRVEAVSKCQA